MSEAVTSDDVAVVISRATGIPLTSLVEGEREKLLTMEDALKKRVIGQACLKHRSREGFLASILLRCPPLDCAHRTYAVGSTLYFST